MGEFKLLADVPIGETADGRKDLLGFDPLAEVLADAAMNTGDPITIGVYGAWGTGKTSLMRLVYDIVDKAEEAEGKSPSPVPVWFNAWQYEREEHLIGPLVAAVESAIGGKDNSKRARLLRAALRSIGAGLSINGTVGIPQIATMNINFSANEMIKRRDEIIAAESAARGIYFNAFEQLRDVQKSGDRGRIVVFIDDLDRCFPDRALALLEDIKLVLNHPGFSFVLGVNDKVIRDFVRKKYAKDFHEKEALPEDDSDKEGNLAKEDYLDKIVQLGYRVPVQDQISIEDYTEDLLARSELLENSSDIRQAIHLIGDAGNWNPRSIVRNINRIGVTKEVFKRRNEEIDAYTLILHLAAKKPVYAPLVSVLDRDLAGANMTIGSWIESVVLLHLGQERARAFENFESATMEIIGNDQNIVNDGVQVLKDHPHLFDGVATASGRKWLCNDGGCRTFADMVLARTRSPAVLPNAANRDAIIKELVSSMAEIPAGTFMMAVDHEGSLAPPQQESVERFWLQSTTVTKAQWAAVMMDDPVDVTRKDDPKVYISWFEVGEFCRELARLTGKQFRLPTEKEWEYACRAGSVDAYSFGNNPNDLGQYAWYQLNSDGRYHQVAKKKSNKWGLYDMHGNVWEWCNDPYGPNFHMARGGAWNESDPEVLKASRRKTFGLESRHRSVGFRCALSALDDT